MFIALPRIRRNTGDGRRTRARPWGNKKRKIPKIQQCEVVLCQAPRRNGVHGVRLFTKAYFPPVTLQELLPSRSAVRIITDEPPQYSYARPDWNPDTFLARWHNNEGHRSSSVKLAASMTLATAARVLDSMAAHAIEAGWTLRDGLALPVVAGVVLASGWQRALDWGSR